MSGIKPKQVQKGRIFDENAKRYIFFPLHALDFASTQFTSPLWNPKIPRGRIVLLESFTYKTQVIDEQPENLGYGGLTLGEKLMGTDAQVKFLMGNSQGSGFLEQGMVHFDGLVDVDPVTVVEIENLILGEDGANVPSNLKQYKEYLSTVKINEEHPIADLAISTLADMKKSVQTAIDFCTIHTNNLEKELREGQSGKIGIKSLSLTQQYYFTQIEKALPEDRAGVNTGNQIAEGLAKFMAQAGIGGAPQTPSVADDIEKQTLAQQIKDLQEQNESLAKTNEELTEALSAEDDEDVK